MLWLVNRLLTKVRTNQAWLYTTLAGIGTLVGATLFALTQHVSWFTGIYWAIVTVTTVGYGDVVPKDPVGRVVAIGTMIVVIPLVGAVFANWAAAATSLHIGRLFGVHTTSNMTDHLVILGYTPLIPHLLPELLAAHSAVVLVADVDRGQIPDHPQMQFIAGDPTNPHVLAKASLDAAQKIVVVGNSDGDVVMTALEAQQLVPKDIILAVTHSKTAIGALEAVGIRGIASQDLLGEFLTKSLETPHAFNVLHQILASESVVLEEIPVPDVWVGKPLSQVRANAGGLVLGLVRNGTFSLGLPDDPTLTTDSTLVQLRVNAVSAGR
ncbi:MAG: ion channel [Firmicutes bacterium]|nr:ion channel [Bacillota bacterium]